MYNKAIFFDRDGVINKPIILKGKPYAPKNFDEFHIYKYVYKCIKLVKKAGFLTFVVTNQPDVGNNLVDIEVVKNMNKTIQDKLEIDEVFTCYHSQMVNCNCRKPNPYFLFLASKKYNINLNKSYIIGDRISDIQTGLNASCQTVFIDRKYKETNILKKDILNGVYEAKNLYKSVKHIMELENGKPQS